VRERESRERELLGGRGIMRRERFLLGEITERERERERGREREIKR